MPFEVLKSGHMAVQVKVNDKGPYLLIFDTGAPMSLVNNQLADEAGPFKGKLKTPPKANENSMTAPRMDARRVSRPSTMAPPMTSSPTVTSVTKILGCACAACTTGRKNG